MGRLVYVDPVGEDIGNNITHPYEDYCIAVDLMIRIPNRYSCGFASITGEEKKLKYSFFGGTSSANAGYLTTNFTDISMTDPKSNTSECFGIESISINYNERLFPIVSIKFVDIRGATLMSPSEAMYNDKDIEDSRGLYRAFFTMPYPTFLLQFKGFYGKGTTLRLTLQKADIEFNSENGNFNINATFLGQMYGIYADLPLSYLAIAPYTTDGKTFWNEQVEKGNFKFRDKSKNRVQNMIKFPELRHKIASISSNQDILKLEEDKKLVSDEIDGKVNKLTELFNKYPFKNKITVKDGDTVVAENLDWDAYKFTNYYCIIVSTEGEVKNVGQQIYNYYKEVVDHEKDELEANKVYTKKLELDFLKTFEDIANVGYPTLSKYSLKINTTTFKSMQYTHSLYLAAAHGPTVTSETKYAIPANPYEGDNRETSIVESDTFKTALNNENVGGCAYICFFKKIKDTDVFGDVTQKQKDLQTEKEELIERFESAKLKKVEDVMGFRPSVRNMYELVFAHMETFMHCFYSNTKNIKEDLDSKADARSKEYQGVNNEYVDVPLTNDKDSLHNFLPPYTAFYKKEGDEAPKMVYPIHVANKAAELHEIHFIDQLLEASQTFINELPRQTTTNEDDVQEAPSSNINTFIPLTAYDFVNKDKTGNPYKVVKDNLDKGLDEIEALILGIFALRAFYYLAGDSSKRKDRITFGGIEAINLFKVLGDSVIDNTNKGNSFLEFIKKYADGEDLGDKKEYFTDLLCSTKNPMWVLKDNTALFGDTGLTKINHEMLPVGNFNPTSLKTAYNTETYDDTFLDAIVDIDTGYTGNGKDRKIIRNSNTEKTFFIFKDRTYCKKIVDNLKTYINSEEIVSDYGTRAATANLEIRKTNRIEDVYTTMLNLTLENDGSSVYYHEHMFENIKADEIKNMLNTGEGKNDEKFFIKDPSWVNDKEGESIFNHYAYKLNESNNRFQAYLFIHSLPIYGLDDNDGNIVKENKNGIILKSLLLREGAIYWYKDNHNTVISEGTVNGKSVSFLKAPGDKFYVANRGNVGVETTEILPTDDEDGYDMWKYPVGCTQSRIDVLCKMFTDWADNEFSIYKKHLENVELYNEKDMSKGLLKPTGLTGSLNISANELQQFLRDTCFDAYTVIELYDDVDTNFTEGTNKNITCPVGEIENAFKHFMKQLKLIYGAIVKDVKDKGQEAVERKVNLAMIQAEYATDDARLATYMTLKNLYEKWLCSPHNGPDKTWTLDPSVPDSDFNRFVYIDSFHKDIGDEFLISLGKVDEWLSSSIPTINAEDAELTFAINPKSTYEFLALMAEKSGAMLLAVPQKMGEYNSNNIATLFKPLPINSEWLDVGENFVFMYSYQASKHLGSTEMKAMNINGYPGDGDGVDLVTDGDTYFNDEGLSVPGFVVTYAKQNQSIFKNIRLNTTDAGVTDVSIANTMNIAAQAATGPRETLLYGQDIYHVNSNKSFMCEVECMGNAQIMPLMYFQLNNIPFWSGAYQVLKVSHDITPGNFVTKFKGIRLNRHKIPMTKGEIIVTKRRNAGESIIIATPNPNVGGAQSGSGGRNADIVADPNHKLLSSTDLSDIDPQNVNWKNPIICILPGHGPQTGKKQEWYFNYSVATQMVKMLKSKTHEVDKKFVKYNVHLCNQIYEKNGVMCAYHTGTGYGTDEVRDIIAKYGSDCVMSVAVHWNGCGGNKAAVYINYKDRGARNDSQVLANEMIKAFNVMTAKVRGLSDVPEGMANTNPRIHNDVASDGGVNINCACVLTENFYADYPLANMRQYKYIDDKGVLRTGYQFNEGDKNVGDISTDALTHKYAPPYYTKINNRYATVRGWFEGGAKKTKNDIPYVTDGVIVIAEGNVNGIINYINHLQGLEEPYKQPTTTGQVTVKKVPETVLKSSYAERLDSLAKQGKLEEVKPATYGKFEHGAALQSQYTIVIDMRYSTTNNCAKINLYKDITKAYFIPSFANKVRQLAFNLARRGYGIKIWDAIRPDSVQYYARQNIGDMFGHSIRIWNSKSQDAGPNRECTDGGSYHIYGQAVDLTLINLGSHKELDMGTGFDDQDKHKARWVDEGVELNKTNIEAHVRKYFPAKYYDVAKIIENRLILYDAVIEAGLKCIRNEWWHFQDVSRGSIKALF